jgi:hypothetical protein
MHRTKDKRFIGTSGSVVGLAASVNPEFWQEEIENQLLIEKAQNMVCP